MKHSYFIISTIALLLSASAFAQHRISGVVTDQYGDVLIGAGVIVSGTQNGTVTDVEGRYELNLTSADVELEFSFMGMIPQTVRTEGRTVINVSLKDDAIGLGEVITIG